MTRQQNGSARWVELCEAMSLGALIGASGALLIELIKEPALPAPRRAGSLDSDAA